jgi:hypothetical protein
MVRGYQNQRRPITPPPSLFKEQGHAATPQKSAIFAIKYFCQIRNIKAPTTAELQLITGVAPRAQSRVVQSNECRTLYNQVEKGQDPRGRKRTVSEVATEPVANYLTDPLTSLEDKGQPWLDIVDLAGAQVDTSCSKTIQRACKRDYGIINAICEEEKLLDKRQANKRLLFVDKYLGP